MPATHSNRFRRLIEPHLDALFRAAFRLVGNRADAEDLVQETCVRAYPRLDELLGVERPRSWLLRVQHNLFLDGLRRRRRSPIDAAADAQPPTNEAVGDDGPEERLLRDQAEEALHDAWLGLEPGQRALLALRAEGYTIDEMVEISGLPKASVNARLYRARLALAKRLRERSTTSSKCTDDRQTATRSDRLETVK